MSLTNKERDLVEQVAQFHLDYANFIEETGKNTDLEATRELVTWHREAASAVRSLAEIERSQSLEAEPTL